MDLLSEILSHVRLAGTLYFRTSFTSPWGVKVPAYSNVARFHFAHQGRCLIRIAGEERPVGLDQGDLLIITRGAAHTLFCDPSTEEDALPLEEVIEKSGFTGHGTLVYGEYGTNFETQLVCGHFAFDDRANHPLINALPSYIHVKNYGETAGAWMDSTLRVIGAEAGTKDLGSDLIALKMSEIIFAQALRAYLAADGARRPVMAGFSDSQIAAAIKAIHARPNHNWTLKEMAETAGMSRTSFVTRFATRMRMTPSAYLTFWRMELARRKLEAGEGAIIGIAESVGYHSEAAFGRAFKKQFDIAPAAYRRSVRTA